MSTHARNAGLSLTPTGVPGTHVAADLSLTLRSKTVYLCAVRAFVSTLCSRLGFSGAQASQIVLAVDEALANVMKHGYEGRDDGIITVSVFPFSMSSRGPGVRIVIEDEARQVDPAQIKSRDLDDVRPGGLGVHIIQRVMDEAVYERREGLGMRLTLVKHVSSPPASGDTAGLDGVGLDVPGVNRCAGDQADSQPQSNQPPQQRSGGASA